MTGNYEVNVEFIDPGLAAAMERIFATDLRTASADRGRLVAGAACTGRSPSCSWPRCARCSDRCADARSGPPGRDRGLTG